MGRLVGDELLPEEKLTQYGKCRLNGDFDFRGSPRPGKDSDGVSLLRGRLSPNAAADEAFGEGSASKRDAARHTTVGKLRKAGFTVEHSPGKSSPNHVSVRWEHSGWDASVALRFNGCFGMKAEKVDTAEKSE